LISIYHFLLLHEFTYGSIKYGSEAFQRFQTSRLPSLNPLDRARTQASVSGKLFL
tara:strand:- start:36618 stop:36782 length:165 start_codon:yes stop_codon:yes gene_type:complete